MQKYDDRVFKVFKKLAGKKFKDIISTAEQIEKDEKKSPERALADALEVYGLGGSC